MLKTPLYNLPYQFHKEPCGNVEGTQKEEETSSSAQAVHTAEHGVPASATRAGVGFAHVVTKSQLSPGFQKRNQQYHPMMRLSEHFWCAGLLGFVQPACMNSQLV